MKAFLNTVLPQSVLYVHTIILFAFSQSVRIFIYMRIYGYRRVLEKYVTSIFSILRSQNSPKM